MTQKEAHVVRTLAVKGHNGYARDECVLSNVQQRVCEFNELQEKITQDAKTFYAARYQVFCCGQKEESAARKGLYGGGLAVKKSICCVSRLTFMCSLTSDTTRGYSCCPVAEKQLTSSHRAHQLIEPRTPR